MPQQRKHLKYLEENGQLGDWCFANNDADLWLRYPDPERGLASLDAPARGDLIHLYLHRAGQPDGRTPSWEWDGNRWSPTISPSINVIGRWRGFLKNGILETV